MKIDKIKNLEIELVNIKYANKLNKLAYQLKELNKIHLIDKILNEIKNEILLDYTAEFEMVGELSIADHIRQTHIRFRNINDYESYINAFEQDYVSEDAVFNGYSYKLNITQFNLVNRNQYGNGCDLKHEIIEYRANKCFIPTKRYFFIKCINYLSNSNNKEQYLDFIRNEEKQSNIMTIARIQPCLKKLGIILGY